jgi:replicative superfamily II helicase
VLYLGTWQIYIAPFKAPVQEKLQDWSNKLDSIGIKCLEMKTKKTNLAFSLE